MTKEEYRNTIGNWFLDLAKYITTAVLVTPILGGITDQWIVYTSGLVALALCFAIGSWLMLSQPRNKNKNKHKR